MNFQLIILAVLLWYFQNPTAFAIILLLMGVFM